MLPLAASPSCPLRECFDGVATEFAVIGPWEFRSFFEGVWVAVEAGDRRSKRPRTRPSFCGVGPKEVR